MLKKAATSERLTGYNKVLGAFLLTLATIGVLVSIVFVVYVGVRLATTDSAPTYVPDPEPTVSVDPTIMGGTGDYTCLVPGGHLVLTETAEQCTTQFGGQLYGG